MTDQENRKRTLCDLAESTALTPADRALFERPLPTVSACGDPVITALQTTMAKLVDALGLLTVRLADSEARVAALSQRLAAVEQRAPSEDRDIKH